MPLRGKRVSMRPSWRPSQGLAMERLGPEPTEGKDVINPIKVAGSSVSLYNQSQALFYPASPDSVHAAARRGGCGGRLDRLELRLWRSAGAEPDKQAAWYRDV